MYGKNKVQTEDFRKTVPDATMGWVFMQPMVKPFFVRDDEGRLFLKSFGRTTRYYAIESAAHAKALAKRIFRYAVPIILLVLSTWFMFDIVVIAESIGWQISLTFVPPLLAFTCWMFARWRIARGLRPHQGGPYRTVTDAEFRDILRGHEIRGTDRLFPKADADTGCHSRK